MSPLLSWVEIALGIFFANFSEVKCVFMHSPPHTHAFASFGSARNRSTALRAGIFGEHSVQKTFDHSLAIFLPPLQLCVAFLEVVP